METAYIVTGTLTDDHTVALDESLPLAQGKCGYRSNRFRPRLNVHTTKSSRRFVNANVREDISRALAKKLTPTFRRNAIAGTIDFLGLDGQNPNPCEYSPST